MSGWISLHRSILDWEWYDDLNVSRLFIHCILKANHAHGKWKGIEIERGSFITSLDKLSRETGLTVSQIRTCIKKLKSTNEIASKSHAQHTVIYIKNYDSYQGNDKVSDKALARESQSIDTALATNNKENNKNNDNKNKIDFAPLAFNSEEIKEFKEIRARKKGAVTQRVVNEHGKQFELSRKRGYSNDDILNEWSNRGWTAYKDEWMKVPIKKQAPQQQTYDHEAARQREIEEIRKGLI